MEESHEAPGILSAYLYFDKDGRKFRAAIFQGEIKTFAEKKSGWLEHDLLDRWRSVMSKTTERELREFLAAQGFNEQLKKISYGIAEGDDLKTICDSLI